MLLLARAAARIGACAARAGARGRSKACTSIKHHDSENIANWTQPGGQRRTYFYNSSASNFVIPPMKLLYDPREEAILLARYNDKCKTNDAYQMEGDSDVAVWTNRACNVFEDVCAKEYFKTLYMLHAWWGCTGEEECGCPSPEEWAGEYMRPVRKDGRVYRRGSEVAGWFMRRCQLKAIEEAGGCSTVHPGLHWDEEARRPTVSPQQTDMALHHPDMITGSAGGPGRARLRRRPLSSRQQARLRRPPLPSRHLRVPTNLLLFSVHSHMADYNTLGWDAVPRRTTTLLNWDRSMTASDDDENYTNDIGWLTYIGYDGVIVEERSLHNVEWPSFVRPAFVPPPLVNRECYFLQKAQDHPASLITPPRLQLRRAQAYGLRPCLVLDLQAIAKGKLACFVPLPVYQDLWREADRCADLGDRFHLADVEQIISDCVVADRVLAELLPARRSGFSFNCQTYGNSVELILRRTTNKGGLAHR